MHLHRFQPSTTAASGLFVRIDTYLPRYTSGARVALGMDASSSATNQPPLEPLPLPHRNAFKISPLTLTPAVTYATGHNAAPHDSPLAPPRIITRAQPCLNPPSDGYSTSQYGPVSVYAFTARSCPRSSCNVDSMSHLS